MCCQIWLVCRGVAAVAAVAAVAGEDRNVAGSAQQVGGGGVGGRRTWRGRGRGRCDCRTTRS